MFQMLQTVEWFNVLTFKDTHLHLKLFFKVSYAFKIAGVLQKALRLKLFPFSLRDRARAWLNSLSPDSITTWNDLADKYLMKYFPPTKNTKLRNDITSFHQLETTPVIDLLLSKSHVKFESTKRETSGETPAALPNRMPFPVIPQNTLESISPHFNPPCLDFS